MPYTRRDLIRDAALISATGAVACSPLATLPQSKMKKTQTASYNGVRIFFCGSWIFCSDGKSGMYAIARDMLNSNGLSSHMFPFGRYQANQSVAFDRAMPQLLPNPTDGSNFPSPYSVQLAGYTQASSTTVASLFMQPSVPISYFGNTDSSNKLTLNLYQLGVIVISLPLPSRLRPDAHLVEASLMGAKTSLLTKSNTTGLPTAHIFEYDNATGLTFTAGSVSDSIHTGSLDPDASLIHFHFHTVPKSPVNMGDHGPDMFQNLLQLLRLNGKPIDPHTLYLNDPCSSDIKSGWDGIKPGFTAPELDYSYALCQDSSKQGDMLISYNLASCSGSGFGIGGQVLGN